jgi:hypothetical protein
MGEDLSIISTSLEVKVHGFEEEKVRLSEGSLEEEKMRLCEGSLCRKARYHFSCGKSFQ